MDAQVLLVFGIAFSAILIVGLVVAVGILNIDKA